MDMEDRYMAAQEELVIELMEANPELTEAQAEALATDEKIYDRVCEDIADEGDYLNDVRMGK